MSVMMSDFLLTIRFNYHCSLTLQDLSANDRIFKFFNRL